MTKPLPPPDQPDGATASPTDAPSLPIPEPSPPPDQAKALIKAGVAQIAATLQEHDKIPLKQIRHIVHVLGLAATEAIVAEALHIEANGGMLTVDGTRRRTLGGVFFFVVRTRISPEQRYKIFPWVRAVTVGTPAASADGTSPPTATAPPSTGWEDREACIATLQSKSGKATSVKVTLIGRPARVSEQAQFTLLTLTSTGPLPSLPKGIPVPVKVPPTTYSVFIGKKQWNQVAQALKNPEDVLIIEGVQIFDATTKTIAVFATRTTTKLLQQANRPPKPPA